MGAILKVMGLPRSGTNALNILVNLNFDHYVCDKHYHSVDFLGWKHSLPVKTDALNLIEKRINSEVKILFCYRNFGDWEEAIIQRYSGQASGEFTTYSFGSDGFLFNTPLGAELYESLYDFYIKRLEAYQKFCDDNPGKAIMVNYSEIFDQEKLLTRIESSLSLTKSFDKFTYLKKKISFENQVTHHKI
jgi:hypothetical protein